MEIKSSETPKFYQGAEEFINDIFWAETFNKDNKLDLKATIVEKLKKDNAEKDPEYYGHKPGVVHVSSLSGCLRGVIHGMLGTPKDEKEVVTEERKLGVFRAGVLFEEFIVSALGDKMLDRQTEYIYKYKDVILTGRDDGTILHEGVKTMLEAKSVHSDSFWHREKEGTLVATHNQMQIQTYLWLRRECSNVFQLIKDGVSEILYTNMSLDEVAIYKKLENSIVLSPEKEIISNNTTIVVINKPDNSNLNGIFSYISKDDCTIVPCAVKFNPKIISETVLPALDFVNAGYVAKDPNIAPLPSAVVYSKSKNQYQKNWLATYCDHHSKCAGAGWLLEANNIILQKNKELKFRSFPHVEKKDPPVITVVQK